MASPIPDSLSFESAAVRPLTLSTAACGQFQKDYLALQKASVEPKPTGKALLVWGGASSVRSNAIQLATAAGYEVIHTTSTKNFDYVKNLGASHVFDYHSDTVVDDLVGALKDKIIAGEFDAIGLHGALQNCVEVVNRSSGNKFVAMAQRVKDLELPNGVDAKFIIGNELKNNEVSHAIYVDDLPKALEEGKYIAAPEAQVVRKGLEII